MSLIKFIASFVFQAYTMIAVTEFGRNKIVWRKHEQRGFLKLELY